MTESNNNGWVLLHRTVRDSWVWDKKPFSTGQAWVDLILDVNHDIGKFYLNGHLITVAPGQKWTSIRTLAARWGWRNEDVVNFLKALEEDGMIERRPTPSGTLLTLVNYGKFQKPRNAKRNDDRNRKRNAQRNDNRNETNKDKTRIKEEKKKSTSLKEVQETEIDLTAWDELEDEDAAIEH